jgi:hypothetical protein
MSGEICDFMDLPVESCTCPEHAKPSDRRPSEVEHPPPTYEGPRPPKDAILVSATNMAHWYGGCEHLPDYAYLVPPRYGWIEDRTLWPQIGQRQIRATAGNTDRVAERRCSDCD